MGEGVIYIALGTSIFGLIALTFVSESLEPPYTSISDINTGFVGKNVHTAGQTTGLHKFKGGSLQIELSETNNSVDVFIPYSTASQLNFKPDLNQSIDVIGMVEIYQGRLEVSVEKQSNIRLVEK